MLSHRRTERRFFRIVPFLSIILPVLGCAQQELQYRVTGPINQPSCSLGSLRIEAVPIDTADLNKDHPFVWRGSTTAGFMVFDVKIASSDTRDLLYLIGHPDFPAFVTPRLTTRNLTKEAVAALEAEGRAELVGTDQLDLAMLTHERATIILETGDRYEALSRSEFHERYIYLMQKEMWRATRLAFIPYAGGFIAASKIHGASEKMQERSMQAEQMVLRPGVVPANSVVRGYLVFAWPPGVKPCSLTLRLPVQPGQAGSLQYKIESVDRSRAPSEMSGRSAASQPAPSQE